MFRTAIPVIKVNGSVAALAFYGTSLGLTLVSSWRPDETRTDPCYMTLARDGARLHVHSFQGGVSGSTSVYVLVDDVDALHAELMSKGVLVSGPLDQTRGMREIGVRDADGNAITFGQRLAPATC